MALIKCHECFKEISDKANSCPHCGAPKIVEQNILQKDISVELKKNDTDMKDERCKECDDILVDLYIGSPAKKTYSGDKKICLSCKIKVSKCPVCSERIRSKNAKQCSNCFSSWKPKGYTDTLAQSRRNRGTVVRCPNCRSNSITSNKKGFGLGKALVGGVLTGGVGLLAGFLGSQKVNITCLSCGHRWTP